VRSAIVEVKRERGLAERNEGREDKKNWQHEATALTQTEISDHHKLFT